MKPATASVMRSRSGLSSSRGEPLDVVGRIAVGGLGDAIERTLDLVEAEQERTGKRRNSGHLQSPRFQATLTGAPKAPHRTGNALAHPIDPNMGSRG